MLLYFVHLAFLTYTVMLIARIAGSWFPQLMQYPLMQFLMRMTEPYLNVFRRFIPPIGGMLDISPILGFLALKLGEKLILSLLQ